MKYPRLTEGGGPDDGELAAAIRALRAEAASPHEVEALARRLAPQLTAAPLTRGSLPSLSGSSKWLVSIVLAFGVGLFATLQFGRRAAEPIAVPAELPPGPAATPAAPVPSAPAIVESPPPSAATGELPVAPVRPAPPRAARPKPQAKAAAPEPARLTAAGDSPSPESELALLGRAQSALDPQPRAALSLAEEHAATYPRGLFVQEREMLAIQALLKLRQRRAALERAEAFLANYPTSPHARHLRPLVEASE